MPRRIALIDLVGLSPALIGPHTPAIAAFAREKGGVRTMRPTLPAVTTSVQTSMLTGVGPAEHGIVASGAVVVDEQHVAGHAADVEGAERGAVGVALG